jgi:hypothetical protein
MATTFRALVEKVNTTYRDVMAHVEDRFQKFYAVEREVATDVADRLDVISDSLAVSCDETQEDATNIDEITLPWNHYEAILHLYSTNRSEYYVVLNAAKRFRKMRLDKSLDYRKHLEHTCA